MRPLKRWASAVVHDDNLDLYLLAAAALTFTVLGATGVAGGAVMSSITLATLAVLALSQIRSRGHVARIAEHQRIEPLAVLRRTFPEDLDNRRSSAKDFLYVGISMYRTLPTLRRELQRMAQHNHRVRIVLTDPSDEWLMRAGALRSGAIDHEDLAARITATLAELGRLSRGASRPVEVRVAAILPTACLNVLDQDSPDGLVVVQHYEYQPPNDSAPIMRLTANDGYWYGHFVQEAERIWANAAPWPPTGTAPMTRLPRPRFAQEFGPDLYRGMESAADLLITGVTRNTLLTGRYGEIERCLRNGGRVRFLLVDPASEAMEVACDRYYAMRGAEHTRQRVAHSIGLIRQLRDSTGGDISVRLTSYALGVGAIAIDGPAGAIMYLEYFIYRAPGEPKFVLEPHDGDAYQQFRGEAEIVWDNATPVALAEAR